MFRFVVILVLVFGLFAGLMYFQMYKQADRFISRVQLEALEAFDSRAGFNSIEEKVREIAAEEKVTLDRNSPEIEITDSARARAVAMVGAAPPRAGSEQIVVTATFKVERAIFSHTYTRTASKVLSGAPVGGGGRQSGGFTGGVNMSRPSRDIGSHRQSINKAVGGRNP